MRNIRQEITLHTFQTMCLCQIFDNEGKVLRICIWLWRICTIGCYFAHSLRGKWGNRDFPSQIAPLFFKMALLYTPRDNTLLYQGYQSRIWQECIERLAL